MHGEHVHMADTHDLFLETLQRYERPLIRYAHSVTGDLEEARDVVQDVFVKFHRCFDTLDSQRVSAWLFTVCRNRALDHQRKQHRFVVMETASLDLEMSSEPSPIEVLEQQDTASALRQLIETLPARQREAVRLKFIAGLDYNEISAAMKTSIGNVGYLIHHGVNALKTKWQEHEQPQPARMQAVLA